METDLAEICVAPGIPLTPIQSEGEVITVPTLQLLAYAQGPGFTRLRLTGGQTLDVRETTDHIDRVIRAAANSAQWPY